MAKFGSALFNRLVIIIPYAWLLFFFLIPFFIVIRISLSEDGRRHAAPICRCSTSHPASAGSSTISSSSRSTTMSG